MSPTSGRYYELGSNGTKPPDTLRPKARTPEPVSRRTELGFDISSNNNGKAIEGSPRYKLVHVLLQFSHNCQLLDFIEKTKILLCGIV